MDSTQRYAYGVLFLFGITGGSHAQVADPFAVVQTSLPTEVDYTVEDMTNPLQRARFWAEMSRDWRTFQRQHPDLTSEENRQILDLQVQLVSAGVLLNAHGWPVACQAFEDVLEEQQRNRLLPRAWQALWGWRVLWMSTCQEQGGIERSTFRRAQHQWRQVQRQALPETEGTTWDRWTTRGAQRLVMASFREHYTDSQIECLRTHWPVQLRAGLDRHQGLPEMARSCGMSASTTWWGIEACVGCGDHPVPLTVRRGADWVWNNAELNLP